MLVLLKNHRLSVTSFWWNLSTVTGAEKFVDISGAVHLVRLSGQAAITEGQSVNAVMTTLGVVESVRTTDAEYHSSHPMFNQIDVA
jgi:steroid 5-alpha reductase family enzyme